MDEAAQAVRCLVGITIRHLGPGPPDRSRDLLESLHADDGETVCLKPVSTCIQGSEAILSRRRRRRSPTYPYHLVTIRQSIGRKLDPSCSVSDLWSSHTRYASTREGDLILPQTRLSSPRWSPDFGYLAPRHAAPALKSIMIRRDGASERLVQVVESS